ncbi:MAG: hypothetical protein RIF32_23085 [Leptospirales bacterium]
MSGDPSAQALNILNSDLNARINPERSRAFDRAKLEASREILFDLSQKLWPEARGERISVVGSNGKGSTAWYLSALAESALRNSPAKSTAADAASASAERAERARVGLYTSPHLESVLERIRLNRESLSAQTAVAELEYLQQILADYAKFSYFEILTLLAWRTFQSLGCPVQVFEAGLGGRFDATRLARAQTVVLTRIDLEHTKILGDTPLAILKEKLGIVTPECRRVFYGPQANLAVDDIETEIRRLAPTARIHPWRPVDSYPDYLAENLAFARFILTRVGRSIGLALPVPAPARASSVSSNSAATPVSPPPARLERRRIRRTSNDGGDRNPDVAAFFDVAHNPASITRALRDLAGRPDFPGFDRTDLRLGVLKDRDPVECLAAAGAVGFRLARLLCGSDLAPPPPELTRALPDMAVELEALGTGAAPSPPRSGTQAVIVLGSHRIYNYFVDLTAGGEKTDPYI